MKFDPEEFVAQVDGVFANTLASFGFKISGKRYYHDWASCRFYRAGDRYIEINANCYFRDGQPECRVILGVGPHEWPDSDWNAIALWRLSKTGGNYPFQRLENIPSILATMRNDLLEQAEDFLSGNVDRFLMQRAAQNVGREPYMVHSPQPDGTYQSSHDPESQQLKEKYSQEKNA